jgi:DNA polymerase III subunit epsilon
LINYSLFCRVYAVVDIETTSGSSKNGKITEIAIFVHDGEKIVDSFESLIDPECHIPGYITRITGISNEMVAQAPKFYEVAKKIVELTENRVFVAHNVNFDYQFVCKEFSELGYDYQRKKLCTVQLGRRYLPGHHSYSLGKLCNDLGITINGRHRAGGDAFATVKVLELILQKHTLKRII